MLTSIVRLYYSRRACYVQVRLVFWVAGQAERDSPRMLLKINFYSTYGCADDPFYHTIDNRDILNVKRVKDED